MIRDLEEGDLTRLTKIYNWYIRNTEITFETEELSTEAFSQRAKGIQKRYPYLVLEEEGKVMGYAYLDTFNTRAAYDWTADLSIYLDQSVRGKGYGSMLMEAILRMAKRDGYYNVVSLITQGNTGSEKIHEKFGFVRKALFENYGYKNGKWLGVTYYSKALVSQPSAAPEKPMNHPYNAD